MRRQKCQTWELKDGKYQPVIMEHHVVDEIIARLAWNKIKVVRINCAVGGKVRPNDPGIPDLIGWIPAITPMKDRIVLPGGGTFNIPIHLGNEHPAIPLYIEVKRPKGVGRREGVRRLAQIRFIEEAKSDGCVAFFASSWDDVVRELAGVGVKLC